MKQILDFVLSQAYTEAKAHAKSGNARQNYRAEVELTQYLSHCSIFSEEAMLVRILAHQKCCIGDYSQLATQIEMLAIENLNWDKLNALIEDAPFNNGSAAYLVFKIFKSKECTEAREVFMKYHDLYDFNKIEWPSELSDTCQNMAAQIGIYHSMHAGK